ncbi:MAG TPA: S24/S26 family peptidase [Methylomirabilota bacterium]
MTEILRERLGAGESVWLPVCGGSMRPLLGPGARIFVTPPRRPRFGTLLAYESEGTLVCHRVIGWRGAALLTRADHRGGGPEVVSGPQIVGIVAAFERRGVTVDLFTLRQRALAIFMAARSFGAATWWYVLQAVAGPAPRRPGRVARVLTVRRRAWPRA